MFLLPVASIASGVIWYITKSSQSPGTNIALFCSVLVFAMFYIVLGKSHTTETILLAAAQTVFAALFANRGDGDGLWMLVIPFVISYLAMTLGAQVILDFNFAYGKIRTLKE